MQSSADTESNKGSDESVALYLQTFSKTMTVMIVLHDIYTNIT